MHGAEFLELIMLPVGRAEAANPGAACSSRRSQPPDLSSKEPRGAGRRELQSHPKILEFLETGKNWEGRTPGFLARGGPPVCVTQMMRLAPTCMHGVLREGGSA